LSGFYGYLFKMNDPAIGYNEDPVRNRRNKALRLAMRKGFDWKTFGKRIMDDIYRIYPGVISPGELGYDKNLLNECITYDPEGAKKLLKENGWNEKNLPLIEYHFVSTVEKRQEFELFRGFMKKIGIPKNKFKSITYSTHGDYVKAIFQGKIMFWLLDFRSGYADPETNLRFFWSSNIGGLNVIGFSNPEFDKAFEKISAMRSSPQRNRLLTEANRVYINEVAGITSISPVFVLLTHKNVNLYMRQSIKNILKNVALDD